MNYKLAVFGDSYADNKAPTDFNDGWHQMLCDIKGWDISETVNFGTSGSNNWAAYRKFLDFTENHTADYYVVSLTDHLRFPMVYNDQSSWQYSQCYIHGENIRPKDGEVFIEQCKLTPLDNSDHSVYDLFETFFTVNPESNKYMGVTTFVSQMVWLELNRHAKKHNLNLLVIIPFSNTVQKYFDWCDTNIPVIINVDDVSLKEMGKDLPEWDGVHWVNKHNHNSNDSRTNHLCKHNNIILAELMVDLFKNPRVADYSKENNLLTYEDGALDAYGTVLFKEQYRN